MNVEVVQSIGVSPARILFGEAVDLDRGILTPNSRLGSHDHGDQTEYMNELIKAQRAVIQYAAKQQGKTDAEHKLTATQAIVGEPTAYQAGSQVLLQYPSSGFTKPRPPHKLLTQLQGPLEVVSNKGHEYTLNNHVTGRETKAHVSRLSNFNYDKTRVNPLAVAARDTDFELVERILEHRGFTGKKGADRRENLQFLVKWANQEEPTWHPWKDFRNNWVVHAYMLQFPYLERILNERWRPQLPVPAPADPLAAQEAPVPVQPKRKRRREPVPQLPPAPITVAPGDQPIALTRAQLKATTVGNKP